MAWIVDSLRSALNSLGARTRSGAASTALPGIFTHQLALAAYMSSGMLRKVIAIPANDRVREWRDWQAEEEEITKIEAEERRLGVQAKFKELEILRGTGGGALLMITEGDHASELLPDQIGEGGLIAINIVSRWQLRGLDWIRDLASPDYGTPTLWELQGEGGPSTKMHPSRVICFKGDPVPGGNTIDIEEKFWGDSTLLRVFKEVERSDDTQGWFAELVKKAKLTRFGIPDLDAEDEKRVAARVAMIAQGENIMNATIYRSASNGDSGEEISDYEVTWAGIPAVMDAFDQRVAAVADIPFTRLMGRSPAGMNATGSHDTDNWNKMVASGQLLETKPCFEKLDPILLRSAGAKDPDNVWWIFAPLNTPTEKEVAETFKLITEAVQNLITAGVAPSVAIAEAVQNLIEERGYLPGLAQALKKLPEEERFGGDPKPTEEEMLGDPSAIAGRPQPAVRQKVAANDAQPRTLYVRRDVLNVAEIAAWAKKQGLPPLQDSLHVTLIYSLTPMDWIKAGNAIEWGDQKKDGTITIAPGGPRATEPLGDRSAVILFASSELYYRHQAIVQAGASHSYDDYQPHISLTGDPVDLSKVEPYRGKIVLGPEIFEEIDQGRS